MTVNDTPSKPTKGRPRKHLSAELKKAANAAAAKTYRAGQNAKKVAWWDAKKVSHSDIIDLSAMRPPWHLMHS